MVLVNNIWVLFLLYYPTKPLKGTKACHTYKPTRANPQCPCSTPHAGRMLNKVPFTNTIYRHPNSSRRLFDQLPDIPCPLQPLLVIGITAQCLAAEKDPQELSQPNGVFGAAELRTGPPADDAPLLDRVEDPFYEQFLVTAREGSFLCVPERLESCDEVLERRVQANEDIDGPCNVCVQDEASQIRSEERRV